MIVELRSLCGTTTWTLTLGQKVKVMLTYCTALAAGLWPIEENKSLNFSFKICGSLQQKNFKMLLLTNT